MENDLHINIDFSRDALGFSNLQPLLPLLSDYLIKTKDQDYLSLNYEYIRYLFPDFKNLINKKRLSITSSVSFGERIRFYQYTKIQQPVFFLCNVLFEYLYENSDSTFLFKFTNTTNMNKTDEMFMNTFLIRYRFSQKSNIRVCFEDEDIYDEIIPIHYELSHNFKNSTYSHLSLDDLRGEFERAMSLGFQEDAIRLGNLYLEKMPTEEYEIIMNVGLAYVLFDMPQIGETYYHYVLNKTSNSRILADVYYCLAMLYMRHNHKDKLNLSKAEVYLNKGKKIIEDNKKELGKAYTFLRIFNRNGRALVEFKNKNIDTAHHYCVDGQRTLLNCYGNKKHILHRTVLIYNCTMTSKALREYEETKIFFDMLLSLDPYYSDYWYDKAKFYSSIDESEESLYAFSRSLELNPYNPDLYFERAEEHVKQGQYELAKKDFSRALEINPLDENILLNYGALLLNMEEYEDFLQIIRPKEAFIDNYKIINNLGIAYLSIGDIENAIKQFKKSLSINKSSPESHANIAICLYQNNRTEEALTHLNNALDLAPYETTYLYNKLILLEENGDRSALQMYLEELQSIKDNNSEIGNMIADYMVN